MPANFSAINARLRAIPGYLDAVRGANQYQRGQVARQFALANGVPYTDLPAGAVNERGEFVDPNADHWYSDPRVLGPIAVGAAGGIGAALMAPAAAGSAGAAAGASGSSGVTSGAYSGLAPFGGAGAASAAGGGVSTVAPSIAAGRGVASWLSPVLQYGVPIAGQLVGSVIQSRANSAANQTQADLTREALEDARKQREYEQQRDAEQREYDRRQQAEAIARSQEDQTYRRNQYSAYVGTLEPYRSAGTTSVTTLSDLLGRSVYNSGRS